MKTIRLTLFFFTFFLINPSSTRLSATNHVSSNTSDVPKKNIFFGPEIPTTRISESYYFYNKFPYKTAKTLSYKKDDLKKYASAKVIEVWDDSHIDSLFWIIQNESGWDHRAQNDHSTAYGIGQFLNSTWKLVGYKKSSDPYKQIDAMIKYIDVSYGNPKKAEQFKRKKGWY